MLIRKIDDNNQEQAYSLVMKTFLQYEAPDYSAEGVETFRKSVIDNEAYQKELVLYGAYDDNHLLGIIATRSNGNHIALFFVDGMYQKQGIGKKLFQAVVNNSSADKITVNSSPYAVEVYHHLGFVDTAKEQVTDGMRYTPMIYRKRNHATAKTVSIVAAAALLISAVNMIISSCSNFSIILFCCMIAIFCSSLSFHSAEKEKRGK